MSKKLKRILNYVQLLTDGESKSGSNLMIFASMIASQMFFPRRHMRRYIWLFSNDDRKSNHTRGRQIHVFHNHSSYLQYHSLWAHCRHSLRFEWMSALVNSCLSQQFNSLTKLITVHINISLSSRYMRMPSKFSQQPHTNAFVCQARDVCTPSTMAGGIFKPTSFVNIEE